MLGSRTDGTRAPAHNPWRALRVLIIWNMPAEGIDQGTGRCKVPGLATSIAPCPGHGLTGFPSTQASATSRSGTLWSLKAG